MEFYTQYVRPSLEECPLEYHNDEGKVETAGFISTEKMVRRLIDAGERLVAFRAAEFGPEEEVPEDYEPLGALNKLDALRLQKDVDKRLKAQKDDFEKRKKEAPPVEEKKAGGSAEPPAKEE